MTPVDSSGRQKLEPGLRYRHRPHHSSLIAYVSSVPLRRGLGDLGGSEAHMKNSSTRQFYAFGVIDCVVLFHSWWQIVINDPIV